MIINSVMPTIITIKAFAIPYFKRKWDTKFTNSPYVTRQTSLQCYKDVYNGAKYDIHFKYSDCLNVIYISCMYGIGMPVLFPIASFTLLMQMICEKTQLAYTVKLPPAMDDSLSNNALRMIQFAPLFLLFNGYWMIDNQQIF